MCWVPSRCQLADGLTKAGIDEKLNPANNILKLGVKNIADLLNIDWARMTLLFDVLC